MAKTPWAIAVIVALFACNGDKDDTGSSVGDGGASDDGGSGSIWYGGPVVKSAKGSGSTFRNYPLYFRLSYSVTRAISPLSYGSTFVRSSY